LKEKLESLIASADPGPRPDVATVQAERDRQKLLEQERKDAQERARKKSDNKLAKSDLQEYREERQRKKIRKQMAG
jgi:hypothetical protein